MNYIKYLSVALLAVIALSCGNEDHSVSIMSRAYYKCDDNIVIEIENDRASMNASIYKGKELLMGRSLVRDSVAREEIFSTHDLSITLLDSTIEVTAKNIKASGCYKSESEMERRGVRDIYYYISDDGALITTQNIPNGRIQFKLQLGQNIVLDTVLPHVRAASGVKYEQGDIMFWVKQNTAMLIYQGVLYGHCVVMFDDEFALDPCSDVPLHAGVISFLKNELKDDITIMSDADRNYYTERVDINDDGQEEIFIALVNSYFCGTGGCTWYLLNPDYTVLGEFTVSDFPIYLSDSLSNGYRDIYVRSDGKYHVLKFNNGYPSNPSVEPLFDLFSHSEYTTGGTVRVLEWAYLKSCKF